MVETLSLNNTIFTYGAFILISAFSIVYIPAVTPFIVGVTGLAWAWFRQKSLQSHSNTPSPLVDSITWTSVYEKLEKNTSDVRYLSQLRLDATQQQRALLEGLQQDLEILTNDFSTYRSSHQHDLDQAKQSYDILQAQHDALKLENANMIKTINTLHLKSSDQEQLHQSARNTSQLDMDAMLKKLAGMEQIKLGLEQDLELLRQCRSADIDKMAALENTIEQLEKEHTQLRNDHASIANMLTTLESQTNALQHSKDAAIHELDALRLEKTALAEKMAAIEHRGDTWNQQTTTFEQQLDALTQEKGDLEKMIATMEQERDSQASKLDALQQEIDTLEQNKERQANELNDMVQEIAVMKDMNQNLTKEHHQQAETIERERDELKDQLSKEQLKTEHLQLFVRENTKELHRAAADALGYQQQMEELKSQLEQQLDQNADMEQQMNELNLYVHEKDLALATMQQKEEQLLADLDEMGRKLEQKDELTSVMARIQQHMVDLEHLEKDKETIVMELETLEENKKMATMDLEALENEKCKLSTALKKTWQEQQQQQQQEGEASSWHEQMHNNRPRSPHVIYPPVKASRSSSIPRLSNTNLTLSRSKSSRLATTSSGTGKSVVQQELYQTVRRLESMVVELQRQLDDAHAQLEDREQRLCHFLTNDTVR